MSVILVDMGKFKQNMKGVSKAWDELYLGTEGLNVANIASEFLCWCAKE